MLYDLDFLENYGNRLKMIDYENMMVKFRHVDKDGNRNYKIYKVKVENPSDHVIEVHYTFQKVTGIDEHGWWDDDKIPEIDFDKALDQWTEFRIPKEHPLYLGSEIGQRRRISKLSIGGSMNDEGDQGTASEESTPVRFLVSFRGEVRRIDVFSVAKTDEGIILKVELLIPEEKTLFRSRNLKEQTELVEDLLEKIATMPPEKQKARESEDHEESSVEP